MFSNRDTLFGIGIVHLIADEKIATKYKDDLLCCSLQISFYYSFADKLQFLIKKLRIRYSNYSQKISFRRTWGKMQYSSQLERNDSQIKKMVKKSTDDTSS
jgi:hypothetical protein